MLDDLGGQFSQKLRAAMEDKDHSLLVRPPAKEQVGMYISIKQANRGSDTGFSPTAAANKFNAGQRFSEFAGPGGYTNQSVCKRARDRVDAILGNISSISDNEVGPSNAKESVR